MIIHLKDHVSAERAEEIAESIGAFFVNSGGKKVLISGSGMKQVPAIIEGEVDEFWEFDNDIQLASQKYRAVKREVKIEMIFTSRFFCAKQ